jgi:hypothetical protein
VVLATQEKLNQLPWPLHQASAPVTDLHYSEIIILETRRDQILKSVQLGFESQRNAMTRTPGRKDEDHRNSDGYKVGITNILRHGTVLLTREQFA